MFIQDMLIPEARHLRNSMVDTVAHNSNILSGDFFVFGTSKTKNIFGIEAEIMEYINCSDTSLACLSSFLHTYQLFIKYNNVTLLSSASVEHFAIFPRRNYLRYMKKSIVRRKF